MDKIVWCCLKEDGIKLIEPNEIVGRRYLEDADSDFIDMRN